MSKPTFNPMGQRFDPEKPWSSVREYIHIPGAPAKMIEFGVLKAFKEMEAEMKAFVHPRCWKYVQWFRVPPKPPMKGRLGWRYVKP